MEFLFNWVLNLTNEIAKFGTWLTTNLPNTNFTPLTIFSVAGVSLLITFHTIRLFIGG